MEKSRRCEICNTNVHQASYAKHLRSKKHLQNLGKNDKNIPEWLFKEKQGPIKKKMNYVYKAETLKPIARHNIKLHDKELDKELTKKMYNPYYFTNEKLKIVLKLNLDSHNSNHASSILSIIQILTGFGNETRYINKILKKAIISARLLNQYKFNYHKLFPASFYKTNEEDERSDEIEFFVNLDFNQNLTESNLILKTLTLNLN